jgi:hypothetical protein
MPPPALWHTVHFLMPAVQIIMDCV